MRDGWVETTLGEIAKINPESTPKWPDDKEIRYVDIASVNWGKPIPVNTPTVRFGEAPGRARRVIRAGDVIASTVRPNLRAFAAVPPELDGEVASTGFAVLRARAELALPEFVWSIVSHEAFCDDMVGKATGSNYPAVRPPDVASHQLLLPPLHEQRRIVDLVSALDEAIATQGAVRKVALNERAALLRDLDEVSALGTRTTLGDVVYGAGGSIKTGPFGTALKAAEYSSDGVPVISTGEVRHGYLLVRDKTPRVGSTVLTRLPGYTLNAGDIVFARKGAVDRSAWVNESEAGYFLGSDGLRVRTGLPLEDSRLVALQLQTPSTLAWLELNATGTIMKGLNQRILESIPIGRPTDELKLRFVAPLLALDAVIAGHDAAERSLLQLRSNVLTALLSGEHEIPESYDALLEADEAVA